MTDPEEENGSFAELVFDISNQFDESCQQRHQMGQEKYGPGKFLTVDTLQEAIDEVVDLANYARYTYIRLRLLQASIDLLIREVPEHVAGQAEGFIKASDATAVREK